MLSAAAAACCCHIWICVQLWSDQTTPWSGISDPLTISKWARQIQSNGSVDLVPVDLEEYLFPVNRAPFTENVDAKLVPYAFNSATQQDEPVSFPSSLFLFPNQITAITASVSAVNDIFNNPSFACPVSGVAATFGNNAQTVLRLGDSFTVSFASTIVPARVKICGRYQPQPIVNNGIDGQYRFTHTVQSGDDNGACSLMVYLPYRWGVLPVYEQATGLSVEIRPNEGMLDRWRSIRLSSEFLYRIQVVVAAHNVFGGISVCGFSRPRLLS